MRADEYDELIADPTAFLYNMWLPRISSEVSKIGEPSCYRNNLSFVKGAMAMLSYVALLALDWDHVKDIHHHSMFLVGLAVTGFVITYQVRRVRALSKFYERRSLP